MVKEILRFGWLMLLVWGWVSIAFDIYHGLAGQEWIVRYGAVYACIALIVTCIADYLKKLVQRRNQ